MFLSKATLTALTLMGSVNSAVPKIRPSPERRADQSCSATDHFFWVSYSVWIGVPYIGQTDCDATYHEIYNDVGEITNWQCVEEDGYIRLWFNTVEGHSSDINYALRQRYPSVNDFGCPGD